MATAHLTSGAERHLSDYWQVVCRRASVIAAFFVICSVTVSLGAYLIQPVYQSSVSLIIQSESTNIQNADTSSDVANFSIFENYIATQIALIRSNAVAGKVFDEFKLAESPRYREHRILGKNWAHKFADDISIDRVRDTRMIEITVYNPDAQTAADIANRLAELYSQDNRTRRSLTFIQNQQMTSLNAEYLRLQSKLEGLSNTFGPKHPEMISLKKEINDIVARIQRQGSSAGQSSSEAEQQDLTEALLQIQQGSVLSSAKMNNIEIVDRAVASTRIAKPNRPVMIVLGVIMGLVGGVLLAFFVDYMDGSIKTESELKRVLGDVPILGVLLAGPKRGGRGVRRTAKSSKLDRMVHEASATPSAEAYRLLRTRILWSIPANEGIKDILITSSIPGEGKTTVASNLAIALSQANLRVLLVDIDVRKGSVRDSFGLKQSKGIANCLTEGLPFSNVVQESSIPRVSVIAAGKSDIESSQLFASAQMKRFIQEARDSFDLVIYDTPPLTVISDAAMVAPHIGAVLMVARSGYTPARVLKTGLAILQDSKARLIGAILNDHESSDNRSYARYYQSYQRRG